MVSERKERLYNEYRQNVRKRDAARQKLWAAINAKDLDQVKELFHSHQLDIYEANMALSLALENDWGEGTRALLELAIDPAEDISDLRWAESIEPFQLWAEFGADFKPGGHELLPFFLTRRDILDFILDHGADINALLKDQNMESERDGTHYLLNRIAMGGDIDTFDHLVSRGADYTRTIALHFAACCEDQNKSAAMIAHLIQKYHLDPNMDEACNGLRWRFSSLSEDEGGPLNWAAHHSNVAAAETLLKFGAKPTNLEMSAAIEQGDAALPIVKMLLKAGVDPTPGLQQAVACDNFEVAKLCLEGGADPDKALGWPGGGPGGRPKKVEVLTGKVGDLVNEWKSKYKAERKEEDPGDMIDSLKI